MRFFRRLFLNLVLANFVILLLMVFSSNAFSQGFSGMKIKIGEEAPDFTLKTIDGEEITLSSFRGKKVVVLDFWATWCSECKKEMPQLVRVYKQFQPNCIFLAMTLDENMKKIRKTIEDKGVTYPVLIDKDALVATELYQLSGPIPLKVVIDAKGIVRYSRIGRDTDEPPEIFFVLEDLIKEIPKQ